MLAVKLTILSLPLGQYFNNIVEQDHQAAKRIIRHMMGFNEFHCARRVIAGRGIMNMIRNGQMRCPDGTRLSAVRQFHSLAN